MPQRIEIRVDGLIELRRSLRTLEQLEDLSELRRGLKAAAGVVAAEARSRVPVRSGRARSSIRPLSSGNKAFVAGGKATVPYYGWLDFGSRSPVSGRSRSIGPWDLSGDGPYKGRFIYPAFAAKEHEVIRLIEHAVNNALRSLGL